MCLTGVALTLSLASASAHAQTACAAFDPVRNTAFLAPAAEWTNSGAWNLSGSPSGGMQYLNDASVGTLTQTIYGVAPGSTLSLNMSCGNGRFGVSPDGNQVKLEVLYGGVVYATFLTSNFANNTGTTGNGPTAGAGYTAQNGATISPAFTGSGWGTVFATGTYTITLPSTVALSGDLVLRAGRNETISAATDDIYLNSVSVQTASVCLRKISQGGTGTFSFTTTGLDTDLVAPGTQTDVTLVTATANTAVAHDAATSIYSGVQPMVRTTTGGFTITESSLPTGYLLSSIACDAGTVSRSGNTATVSGLAPLQATTCTFTNALQPQLRLQKLLPGGRVAAADQFALTIAGTGGPVTATTTGSGTTATGGATISAATIGSSYTLAEALVTGGSSVLADYTSTYSCTNTLAGGQTVGSTSGTSITLTPAAGDNLTCTFSNTAIPRSDLAIAKTPNVTSAATGGLVTYTMAVTNGGPSAANGAVIRDTPDAGLDCTTPSSTAICAAAGGAACPGPTVPVGSLLGSSGVTIPTLPAGGSITVTLQCRVTASGTP